MTPNIYTVVSIMDGEKEWTRNFNNALDAVNCYNSFTDHGLAIYERIVTLVEPNAETHTKIFKHHEVSAVH